MDEEESGSDEELSGEEASDDDLDEGVNTGTSPFEISCFPG